MKPIEFIDLAFSLLVDLNSNTLDIYFDDGELSYCMISLEELSDTRVKMELKMQWGSSADNSSYEAFGSQSWQHAIAIYLVTAGPNG